MKLLADEGVDKPIVEALRFAGFDVTYILEDARGSDDEYILKVSLEQERLLITQDKDFGELVFRLQQAYFGIILIRLLGYPPDAKAEIVVKLVQKYKEELENAFTVIQPKAIRIRKMKI